MKQKSNRLYFIDAMRAWAILMMLQGHFVDGLLDNAFRDSSDAVYSVWQYFRGITAPVFFTVSGFIFTYLLVKVPEIGWDNPRVKKGIKRGLQLLLIGYLLRLNLFGLLVGEVYEAFFLVDVLHCIGLSLLSIIGLYLLTAKTKKWVFPTTLIAVTLVLFLFEPYYKTLSFGFLPQAFANYFTKANGSVFTIIPWLGYATVGGFLSLVFARYKAAKNLYAVAIPLAAALGAGLIFYSSDLFLMLARTTKIQLFADIFFNNYLFIRFGDVLIVFAVFMLFRSLMTNRTLLKIGQSTLSIYVIHFIILYGSFTGLGLYGFFNHSVSPMVVIPSAVLFMIACTYLSLRYEERKAGIKLRIAAALRLVRVRSIPWIQFSVRLLRHSFFKIRFVLMKLFGFVKN